MEITHTVKAEKMIKIYSDIPVLVDLIKLKGDSQLTSDMKDQIQILEQGLQFLVIYDDILSLFHNKRLDPEKMNLNFGEISRIKTTLKEKGLSKIGVLALDSGDFQDWDTLCSKLLTEIQSYKSSIREDCFYFSNGLWNGYCFTVDYFPKFMRCTDVSMANILHLKGDMMVHDEKMKFESVREKLDIFRMVFKYIAKGEAQSSFLDFRCTLNAWAWNAAYLCLLYWVLDENMASEGNLMLSKMYRNFDSPHPSITKHCLQFIECHEIRIDEHCKVGEVVSLDIMRMCLWHLKKKDASEEDRQKVGVIACRFVEFLLHHLRAFLSEDGIVMLGDAIIFLITLIMDPPSAEADEGQPVLIQADAAISDAGLIIISLSSGKKDEVGIAEATNFLLHDFLEKVNTIKAEVRKTFSLSLLDVSFNFSRIDMLCFIDSSIESLKEISTCFSSHLISSIQKELVLLSDLLKASNFEDSFVLELEREHMESKDLWTQIANVAYQTNRTIKSFTYMEGFRGVHVLCLLDIKEKIRHILPIVKRIKDEHVNGSKTCKTEVNLSPMVPLISDHVQEMDEVVVGFEDKAKEIRDWLTSGSEKLDIISIIGMAGMGKTTLAKKVYNDPSMKRHFTSCAWCTVSQSYDSKKLLLDILNDVTMVNDSFFEMEEEELVDRLRKSLKGKRYLIVMDDIWDVGAWNALELSFPDDGNCSRIMFTSRIHYVVLDAKPGSFPYPLCQLSDQESWELLERRLFNDKDICPGDFVQNGKQIATECRGLPLSIILVAGLLKEKIENLDWWKEIGESLDSRISEKSCSKILELSYKHLSEPLKACFLYLGLFQEDKVIRVQKLTKLWVSEGFIQKKGTKDVEIVAKEYVMDLVRRSLLIVCNKSSYGGIKACRIHDLLREFCLEKSEKEHFFKLLQREDVSQLSSDAIDDKHYRISIQTQQWRPLLVRKSSSPLHSILVFPTCTSNAFNISHSSFCNARFLHILDLEEVKFHGDFPEVNGIDFLKILGNMVYY